MRPTELACPESREVPATLAKTAPVEQIVSTDCAGAPVSSRSRSSVKEAVEEMDVHDEEAAEDEAEAEDAANKVTEEEGQAKLK